MCKIAICDDDKEYREKIKTVIETEGILSSNEIRFYEYDVGVKTINKFNPIPYSTLKNSYFVVYRRGLGNI